MGKITLNINEGNEETSYSIDGEEKTLNDESYDRLFKLASTKALLDNAKAMQEAVLAMVKETLNKDEELVENAERVAEKTLSTVEKAIAKMAKDSDIVENLAKISLAELNELLKAVKDNKDLAAANADIAKELADYIENISNDLAPTKVYKKAEKSFNEAKGNKTNLKVN
jgi:Zn-dependent oligopeptidase